MDTLTWGENSVKMFAFILKCGLHLKGSKFFPLRIDNFQKGLGVQESKHEAMKVIPLV